MLQRAIEFANENPGIFGIVICALFLVAILILVLDNRDRKNAQQRIQQMEEQLETKEIIIDHKDAEIWSLKVELFKAREDGKREIHKRDIRIQQLESDKKQLSKWGNEK